MYEIFTGVDAYNAAVPTYKYMIVEDLVIRTSNRFQIETLYSQLKYRAYVDSKKTEHKDKRLFGYIVEIFPSQLLPNPKKNGCLSRTIKAFSFINGEELK